MPTVDSQITPIRWLRNSTGQIVGYRNPVTDADELFNSVTVQTDDLTEVAYAATVTLDRASVSGHINIGALTGNITIANPTGFTKAATLRVWLTQDGTGSRLLTLGNKIKTADGAGITLTTTGAAVDLLTLTYNPTKDIWLASADLAIA